MGAPVASSEAGRAHRSARAAPAARTVPVVVLAALLGPALLLACTRAEQTVAGTGTTSSGVSATGPSGVAGITDVDAARMMRPHGSGTTRRDADGWYVTEYQTDLNGIHVEVSQFPPGTEASAEQRAGLQRVWSEYKKVTERIPNVGTAKRLGYRIIGDPDHWFFEEYVRDHRVLDPERPEVLVFGPEKRLEAVMVWAADVGTHGPQFGGPLTIWHYHIYPEPKCLTYGGMFLAPVEPDPVTGACSEGVASTRTPEMIHIRVDGDQPSTDVHDGQIMMP